MISNSNEFTIDLLSNASMDVFNGNTMASYRNQLSQPIHLQGEWQVALTSLSFPSNINNVNSGEIVVYKNSRTNPNESSNRSRQLGKTRTGIHNSWEDLVSEIVRIAKQKQFDRKFDMIMQKLVLTFGENEGLLFQDEEIPSILGFKGTSDPAHNGFVHIGYQTNFENGTPNTPNRNFGIFPVDITCGSQLIFVIFDIIEYQHVGDSRAPILKIIESERRLRNGSLNTVAPIHHKTYTNLDYKRLLSNSIQSIKVELRSQTGKLIPFTGIGKVVISLKLQRTS